MRRLLIADTSEASAQLLADSLRKQYDISICCDGAALIAKLQDLHPDILVLDLSLPVIDGIRALKQCIDILPPVILAIALYPSDRVIRQAMDLGVGHVLIRPCAMRAVRRHLQELVAQAEAPHMDILSAQSMALRHLLNLGLSPGHDGFHQLRSAIPLFAQDPSMSLSKELYPAVCQRLGSGLDQRAVEHNIRKAITQAWASRDPAIWQRYFPGDREKAPSNREFIGTIALWVEQELAQQIRVRPLPPETETAPPK